MANTTAVVNQLRALHTLTRIEVATTRSRAEQARTAAVRHELRENATAAAGRAERIAQALADVGAPPDPVGAALGWASGLLRATVEQAQPLDQALLGDLALQHQLAERARYLLTGDVPVEVRGLAELLVQDHEVTIERLRVVLTELAVGELRPTSLQELTVGFARMAVLPARLTVEGLQRAAGAAGRGRRAFGGPDRSVTPPRPTPAPHPTPAPSPTPAAEPAAEPAEPETADVVPLHPPTTPDADLPDYVLPDTDLADLSPDDIDAALDAEADADVVAIDAEAGDIKMTVSDADADVDPAADAELTVVDPADTEPTVVDAATGAEHGVVEPDADIQGLVGADRADDAAPVDEIATEAARHDDREGAGQAGSSVAVASDELPIPDYDALPVRRVVVALRTITDDADLTAVEEYERSHKNRAGVLTAVQNRTESLAHDTTDG